MGLERELWTSLFGLLTCDLTLDGWMVKIPSIKIAYTLLNSCESLFHYS